MQWDSFDLEDIYSLRHNSARIDLTFLERKAGHYLTDETWREFLVVLLRNFSVKIGAFAEKKG